MHGKTAIPLRRNCNVPYDRCGALKSPFRARIECGSVVPGLKPFALLSRSFQDPGTCLHHCIIPQPYFQSRSAALCAIEVAAFIPHQPPIRRKRLWVTRRN
jgi:hypothetical protein